MKNKTPNYLTSIESKVRYISEIGKGNFDAKLDQLSEKDDLDLALIGNSSLNF